MELGKVPPHDVEAEQAVLGSMLTDKDAVIRKKKWRWNNGI